MNDIIISSDLLKNINFTLLDSDNINYKFYIDAKKKLNDQFTLIDILNVIDKSKLTDIYTESLRDFNTDILYKSADHGINHNIRVCFFAYVISSLEGVTSRDFEIIMDASKYHDIGRINDYDDDTHGRRSADMISFLEDKYSNEEMFYLKTIITCHSLNDDLFDEIASFFGVNDLERCRKMFQILKDSDGLDRVRIYYPDLDINYLRTDSSKKMVLFSYELFYNYDKFLG